MARVTKAITWLGETTRLVHATKVIRVDGAMQDNYTTTTLSVAQATPRRQAVHKTLSYHENLLRNWLRASWGLGLHMYEYGLLNVRWVTNLLMLQVQRKRLGTFKVLEFCEYVTGSYGKPPPNSGGWSAAYWYVLQSVLARSRVKVMNETRSERKSTNFSIGKSGCEHRLERRE